MFTILAYAVLIVTTLWVVIDAQRLKICFNRKEPYSALNGAVGYLIGCIALWIVVVPIYLVRRARTLRERGMGSTGGTVFGVLAIVAWLLCVAGAFLVPERLSTNALRDQVSTSIQKKLHDTPATQNIHLKSLSLAHESGNEYKGLAALDVSGQEVPKVVQVNYDGKTFSWQFH